MEASQPKMLSSKGEKHGLNDLEKGRGQMHVSSGKTSSLRRKWPTRSSTSAKKWMSRLDDDLPMSSITVPGTHDSAAFTNAWPFIATQTMNITEQLNAGIRYFDLRCGIRDDVVEMVHGPSILGILLDTVLLSMYGWLQIHPTEAIIVQIKRDRKEENATIHFAQAIARTIEAHSQFWRTANTTPTLGELRGKIQLFRRFTTPSIYAYGLDVTKWQDNPTRPFTIYGVHGVKFTIQDHYNFPDPEPLPSLIVKKGGDVAELLNQAAWYDDPNHWYINFVSGYEFNLFYQITPKQVATGGWWAFRWVDGMNPRLKTYLDAHHGKRRYGIVPMDFPEAGNSDLIKAVIRSNFEEPEAGNRCRLVMLLVILLVVLLLIWAWFDLGSESLHCLHLLRCYSLSDLKR